MVIKDFDYAVIGGGIAGYTCALGLAKQGYNIVLFEKDEIGGTCLNKGCIPTKAILKSSQIYKTICKSSEYGINCSNVEFDYKSIIKRKNTIVETLRKNIEQAIKNAKVKVVKTSAQIVDESTVKDQISLDTYEVDEIICATGTKPKPIPGIEFDGNFILNSDDILNLENLPKSILIVGSGAIGCEWAQIMNNFGVETTVIELAPNLLPLADIDISKRLERIFKAQGIKFYTKTSIEKIKNNTVYLSNDTELQPHKILVSIGRVANISEKIPTVKYLGDISEKIQLAHFAYRQALDDIIGLNFDEKLIPSVVYGTPEIAWVGQREQDLEKGTYEKSTTLVSSLGKAWCDGNTDGVIKIIKQDDKIIGAHIMCEQASSMINTLTLAIQKELDIEEICFPHPTYSEGIFECAMKLYKPKMPDDIWIENDGLGYSTEEAYNRWSKEKEKG